MNTTIDILKNDSKLSIKAYYKSRDDLVLFYHFETIKNEVMEGLSHDKKTT